jgi:hypothetical protein
VVAIAEFRILGSVEVSDDGVVKDLGGLRERTLLVQGTAAAGATATLCFDSKSGLLVRLVRFSDSPVGRIVTQIDYGDYREVAGVKMPFRWTVTWLDGRATIELKDVQANAPVDAARFARPAGR